MANFATIEDLEKLWRVLKPTERERAEGLLEIVSDSLRVEADKVGKNLDELAADSDAYASLVPGGGLFIKDTELKRLGLKRQRYGVIDPYA